MKMKNPLGPELLVAGALALTVAAGCSSDDKETNPTTATILATTEVPSTNENTEVFVPPHERAEELRQIFENYKTSFAEDIKDGSFEASAVLGSCVLILDTQSADSYNNYPVHVVPAAAIVTLEIDEYTEIVADVFALDGKYELTEPGIIYDPNGLDVIEGNTADTSIYFGQRYVSALTYFDNEGLEVTEGTFKIEDELIYSPEGYSVGTPIITSYQNAESTEISPLLEELVPKVCNLEFVKERGQETTTTIIEA